jgi:hypothetical protein
MSGDSATTCGTDCQWREGRTPSTEPTTPISPAPLFSQDFCHPVVITKETAKTVWYNCIDQSTSTTCSNAGGCNWSNGKELIPDYDFCAPLELTTNVDTIKTCLTANVVTDCNDGCQWRKGRAGDNTGNQDTTKQMFPTELCHPSKISKDTPLSDFTKCIASDTAVLCSITQDCTWSEGKELIPDFDFCAPMTLTKDVQVIQGCFSQDTSNACNGQCQWVHGNNVVTTPVTPVETPLFSKEFCHPAAVKSTDGTWTSEAIWTLCVEKTVATECSLIQECNWSEGKELIPDSDFCAPAALTDDIKVIQGCVS